MVAYPARASEGHGAAATGAEEAECAYSKPFQAVNKITDCKHAHTNCAEHIDGLRQGQRVSLRCSAGPAQGQLAVLAHVA
jgi:hypothetical protein